MILGLAALSPDRAQATVGFAEWEISTPGGFRIAHGDEWKDEHGDCLLAPGAGQPLVSHLVRWRYYVSYVVGQTETNFFVLREKTGSVARYPTERAFDAAVKKLVAGAPLSDWMRAADGWTEAWFPLVIWPRCKGAPESRPPEIKATCDQFLSPKGLARARLTTWGRLCAAQPARNDGGVEPNTGAATEAIQDWCKLLAIRRP